MGVVPVEFTYKSPLSVAECMERISRSPHTFGKNMYYPDPYEPIIHSETQMTVIFTGGYGGFRKTQYLFTFDWNGTETIIVTKFVHELFGFPFPFTSTCHLDVFMKQKVEGYLVD